MICFFVLPPDVPHLAGPQRVAVPRKPAQVVERAVPARQALKIFPLIVVEAVARADRAQLAQRERGDFGGILYVEMCVVLRVRLEPLLFGPRSVVGEHLADVGVGWVVNVFEEVGHFFYGNIQKKSGKWNVRFCGHLYSQ